MKRIYLNTVLIFIVSFIWSATYYLNTPYFEGHIRPFAYRVLVPVLARGLEFLGIRFDIALVLIMTLSGVGFYLALRKLALEFTELTIRQELWLVVGVLASMILLGFYRKPYDLMTAFLFTLGFYCIYSSQSVWKYLIVFSLACINRETAFLLIPINVISWYGGLEYRIYSKQVWIGWLTSLGIFIESTYAIRHYFSSYPGVSLLIDPVGNILQLASHPYELILGLIFVVGMMMWMTRKPQPRFLKMSFAVLAPALTIMWLVCGQVFEIRVFWEISPIVILLMVL